MVSSLWVTISLCLAFGFGINWSLYFRKIDALTEVLLEWIGLVLILLIGIILMRFVLVASVHPTVQAPPRQCPTTRPLPSG